MTYLRRLRQIRLLRQMRFLGWKDYCPVCRSHLRGFVANASDPDMRWDRMCPVCRSKDPHRRAFLHFWPRLRQRPGTRFLHIAPEPALARRLRPALGKGYVSGDLASGKGRVRFDVAALPFRSGSFDFLYACHVLTQIPGATVEAAVAEMFRVLRPGGSAVIQSGTARGPTLELESATTAERRQRFHYPDVLRCFGLDDYRRLLEGAGFRIVNPAPAPGPDPGKGSRSARIEVVARPARR